MAVIRVAQIRLYPVKGLRGHAVPHAAVEPWGLAGDRRFMVVDPGGRFITQRQLPRMALVEAALVPGGVALSMQGVGRVDVAEPPAEAPTVEASIFRDTVPSRDAGDGAAAWLSAALGRPCRLVHMAEPATARRVDPAFSAATDHVSFADGFPLLVTNMASLDDLNGRLGRPVGMDRFRANVVVEGARAWEEDGWAVLRIGGVRFLGPQDCARCAVPTIDQDTGVKSDDDEPLRTLASFRRKAAGRIIFGQNLIPCGGGRIAVGDTLTAPA